MRETQPLTPPKLLVIESQRDFPDEDLSEANALYLSHELVANQSEQAHAASFDTHLVPLFRLGHEALQMSELPSEDSRASYETFCDGFAASEFAMTFVRPTMYDGTRAVQATSELLRGGVATPNILEKAFDTPRVALIFEGTGIAHVHAKLIPLHGRLASETGVWSPHKEFNEEYQGWLTSTEGPKMDDARLDEIQAKILDAQDEQP